jgi:peptidoglycan/LPS O-acetylase OafA/YrhL
VKKHFGALDGLRGIAALAVATAHVTAYNAGTTALPHAFLAVDFFFILSGFVIAHAYEQRLLSTMGFLEFAELRVARLWPLVLAGVALGALYFVTRNETQSAHAVSIGYLAVAVVFGLFLVPLNMVVGGDGYPLDPPCWSLFFEMIANGLYAILCRYRLLSNGILFAIIAISLLGLIAESRFELWDVPQHFSNRFALATSFFEGASRVGFGFFLGVAFYRCRNHGFFRRIPRLHPALASIVLLVSLGLPPFLSNTYDLIVTILILPLIVAASAHYESRGLEAAVAKFAGWLSYPLYVVHYPVMFFTVGAAKYFGVRLPMMTLEVATLISCLISAYLLGKLYDEPVRSWLARRAHAKFSGLHLAKISAK